MAIDFSFPPELEALRLKVRQFIDTIVRPLEEQLDESNRDQLVSTVVKMRKAAHEWGLWLPHMPKEYGGMGIGHVAMAAVSAEATRARFGPFALNPGSAARMILVEESLFLFVPAHLTVVSRDFGMILQGSAVRKRVMTP